jgi:hypothetical protein
VVRAAGGEKRDTGDGADLAPDPDLLLRLLCTSARPGRCHHRQTESKEGPPKLQTADFFYFPCMHPVMLLFVYYNG